MKCVKTYVLCFLLILSGLTSQGQEKSLFQTWPDSVLAMANSAAQVDYMSEEERQVVYYTNLVRINPPLFATTFFNDYLEKNGVKKDKEVRLLIKELEETDKMKVLSPSKLLTEKAREHAKDMGETGRTGHNASNGKAFRTRMEEASKSYYGINENCNYGLSIGIDIFMDLLIDRNVPNYGHRKNILDPEMRYTGVAIHTHKRFGHNCVQDFGGEKIKGE